MKITSVNVRKIEKEGSRMKGIASVLIDESFAVHDIRIIEGDNGLFIAMPSRKTAPSKEDAQIQKSEHPFFSRNIVAYLFLCITIMKTVGFSSTYFANT